MNVADEFREGGSVSASCRFASSLVTRSEVCSLSAVRRVVAMLDGEPERVQAGMPLPRGWQFILLGADTPRKALRSDGFPGLGVPLPDLGLPRLLLMGRTVGYLGDIPVGSALERTSLILDIVEKEGAPGRMAVVTVGHKLVLAGEPLLLETQTYALLGAEHAGSAKSPMTENVRTHASVTQTVVPDETLLFQYSALGFNSHKIHLDRRYAQEVEGLPGLVVNGGLVTLLMTEFVSEALELTPMQLKTRHLAPLFCDRPVTLSAEKNAQVWDVRAFDDAGRLCATMEVKTQ